MDANPSRSAKPADMLLIEFWNLKRKISLWYLVESCGTVNNFYRGNLDTCRGVEKLISTEPIYIKKLKPNKLRATIPWAGIDIEV